MPSDAAGGCLVIGDNLAPVRELAHGLGAVVQPLPDLSVHDQDGEWPWRKCLVTWEDELRALDWSASVAICTWAPSAPPQEMSDIDHDSWQQRVELPLATWFTAIKVATDCCSDGGSVVIVAERPSPLDSRGRADVLAVADGLVTLTRCAALIAGERGVRFNVVTTELFTAPPTLLGMPSALHTFPGTADHEVAGAVQLLWTRAAAGISGTVVRADCGRTW